MGLSQRTRMKSSIKRMKLYNHMGRVYNELAEMGIYLVRDQRSGQVVQICGLTEQNLLKVPGLFLNFGQQSSVEFAMRRLGLMEEDAQSKLVLDLGAGLGQPARCLCLLNKSLKVVGVELQSDQVDIGNKLSEAIGLDASRLIIVQQDFVGDDNKGLPLPGTVDAMVSWLTILHLSKAQRTKCWRKTWDMLKPGAKIFVEDFFTRGSQGFSTAELEHLSRDVFCDGTQLAFQEKEYVGELEQAGFTDVQFQDMSDEWTVFCNERLRLWVENKDRHVRVHNHETFEDLQEFYKVVANLWNGGNLGGCRVTATKPL